MSEIKPEFIEFWVDETNVFADFRFSHKGSHTELVFTAHTFGGKDTTFSELEDQAVRLFRTVLAQLAENNPADR